MAVKAVKKNVKNILLSICDVKVFLTFIFTEYGTVLTTILPILLTLQCIEVPHNVSTLCYTGTCMLYQESSRIKLAIKHVFGHMINLTSCLLSICCVGLVSMYMWAVELKVCMCLVSDKYIPHFHLEILCCYVSFCFAYITMHRGTPQCVYLMLLYIVLSTTVKFFNAYFSDAQKET
jgi:hypothetical protein